MRTTQRAFFVSTLALVATLISGTAQAQTALEGVMTNKLIKIAVPTDFPPYGFVGIDLKVSTAIIFSIQQHAGPPEVVRTVPTLVDTRGMQRQNSSIRVLRLSRKEIQPPRRGPIFFRLALCWLCEVVVVVKWRVVPPIMACPRARELCSHRFGERPVFSIS